ncbi:glycoside hydrolase family 3 C-terminal domain-containing protein [Nonomuraea sp. NPDC050786]|uniref:glycoside hydrolase family 3 C-terminal domain-containing protein n=1 Tax=Nonomuraea sp. NPDC050786 TaxID=3154840 RepID=UPI003407E626
MAAEPPGMEFLNAGLPLPRRVADLLGRLTLGEKVAMIHAHAPAVPRLGLRSFRTGTEALHGAAWLGPATVFPQAVGLGATWNPAIVEAVGEATGIEVRALHVKDPTVSLNVWAPVVNLLRDPRWGRNEEGYSEDVLLTTAHAVAYCRGLRGTDPRYVRTAPTLKHFLAYNNENARDLTSSALRPRVLHEYDLKVFRDVIQAGVVDGVMPSYNLVNGRPNHVSPYLAALRQWGGDDLVVVSDAGAVGNLADSQRYFPDHPSGHAAAIRAGVDSLTEPVEEAITLARVTEALDRGLLTEEDVDRAVSRVLALRFRTGEFDPDLDPHAAIPESALCAPEHAELARQAAREQVVLLKNDDAVLPLATSGLRVAVIGPFAEDLRTDWYSGELPYRVSVAQGLREALESHGGSVRTTNGADRISLRAVGAGRYVTLSPDAVLTCAAEPAAEQFDVFDWGDGVRTLRAVSAGRFVTARDGGLLVAAAEQPGGWFVQETFHLDGQDDGTVLLRHAHTGLFAAIDPETGALTASAADPGDAEHFAVDLVRDGVERAEELMRDADAVVVVAGNDPHINGRETQDRTTLALPPAQERLVCAAAAHPRSVLVLMSSYPYAVSTSIPAVLWTSHAGQETGHALADVLLGTYAPTGRLPQTWYRSDADLPDILDYDIIKAGHTYQYFQGDVLYPFGHGLTYTSFAYGAAALADQGETVQVNVEVTNTGDRPGLEVVQLYARLDDPAGPWPLRLQAFERVTLAPGQTRTVLLRFAMAGLAHWDVAAQGLRVRPGAYDLLIGRSCTAIQATARLVVPGEPARARPVVGIPVRAVDFDDYEGVTLADTNPAEGDCVTTVDEVPGWIVIRDADLAGGAARLRARVSRASAGNARIEVRRDDPFAGPLLGVLDVASTGGRYAWDAATADLDAPSGVYDLYLVLHGELRLDTFLLEI